jgi:ATP/maltotriose-dependent transcriptional regulator MalT
LLCEAARLTTDPLARGLRIAAAAHNAWKTGHTILAQSLAERAEQTAPLLIRLRGLLLLYSGDQTVALEYLSRCADEMAYTRPEQAAEFRCMAVDAATHLGRLDVARAAALRITELDVAPDYHDYGRLLAASVIDDLDDGSEVWRFFDAAPGPIQHSEAHRWLFPLAIAARGKQPDTARAFALTAYETMRRQGMLAISAIALVWVVELDFRTGHWAEGIAHAEEGLDAARDTGLRQREADYLSQLAMFAAGQGQEVRCRKYAKLALEVGLPMCNRLAAARATWALGLLDLTRGEYESAAEHLASLGAEEMPVAHRQVAIAAIADSVEANARAGNLEVAETLARAAHEQHADRCQALMASDAAIADKHYQLAIEDHRPFERARTALLHGQRLRRDRRLRDARLPLRLAAQLFESIGADVWASRAKVELRACAGTPIDPVPACASLTPQEAAVARLAATGCTNRQIGANLHISHRTVGYHLHKIFAKLGISHRGQLRDIPLD